MPPVDDGTKLDPKSEVGKPDIRQPSIWEIYKAWISLAGVVVAVGVGVVMAMTSFGNQLQQLADNLANQVSEVRKDVRHLDESAEGADREMRENIRNIQDNLSGMKVDVKELSTNIKHLTEDVEYLTKKVMIHESPENPEGIRGASLSKARRESQ